VVSGTKEEIVKRMLLTLVGKQLKITVRERHLQGKRRATWITYEGHLNSVRGEDFEIEGMVTKAKHLPVPYPEGKFVVRLEDVHVFVHGGTVTFPRGRLMLSKGSGDS
jgi:hypothetical protein